MAAAAAAAAGDGASMSSAPLRFFYTHLHDAIRAELGALGAAVLRLDDAAAAGRPLRAELVALRARYRFLERVYKYHSAVEDEVVYPALDRKVRNVTLAYSVEHEDEERLFERLAALLARALAEAGAEGGGGGGGAPARGGAPAARELARLAEQIHTTLRQHLAKEEAQLAPLLLAHFSAAEQAELVAQFLCCVPLAAAAPVLGWVKRRVPRAEQLGLRDAVAGVVSDRLLRQVLVSWLEPSGGDGEAMEAVDGEDAPPAAGTGSDDDGAEFVCCGAACDGAGGAGCPRDADVEEAGARLGGRPPLREIVYFHHAIRSALQSFADAARAARGAPGGPSAAALAALAERHRFLRAVCAFHSASEDEVVFPALKKIAGGAALHHHHHHGGGPENAPPGGGDRLRCEDDHVEESAQLEALGRLLGDVTALARRGAREAAARVDAVAAAADALARAMRRHMAREEADVLPALMRGLCAAEQRAIVWRVLRAMPLRLLERVLPWVAGKLRPRDVAEWLANVRAAAAPADGALVQLLCQWARRGAQLPLLDGAAGGGGAPASGAFRYTADDPALYSNQTCGPASFMSAAGAGADEGEGEGGAGAGAGGERPARRARTGAAAAGGGGGRPPSGHVDAVQELLQRMNGPAAAAGAPGPAAAPPQQPPPPRPDGGRTSHPIDHIFQFHKALRAELAALEGAAVALQAAADGAPDGAPGAPWPPALAALITDLGGRFTFLRGIYTAHSRAEDEVVFPALEAKAALRHVSHAYALDHAQEERLFEDVAAVVDQIAALAAAAAAGGAGAGAGGGAAAAGAGVAGEAGAAAPPPLAALRSAARQLARMCAAVRASLETHVRAEEKELWPLFAEHFSAEEQGRLVGHIIGRTGAEVLTAMISWVRGALTPEERDDMMASLRGAARATAFTQWLGAAMGEGEAGGGAGAGGAAAAGPVAMDEGAAAGAGPPPSLADERRATLAEVAAYLAASGGGGGAGGGAAAAAPPDPGSLAADSSPFRPGWEDIFAMNQRQLEAAVRRLSADAGLEPQRKAYLIQSLMASRYIVAQQRRMQDAAGGGGDAAADAGGGAAPAGAAAPPGGGAAGGAAAAAGGGGAAPAPAAAAAAAAAAAGGLRRYHDAAAGVLGCRHYARRCQLVAPCCGAAHVCRLCHDEATDHTLDRYAVSEMVCMECGARQPVGAACAAPGCGARMAAYYCGICHLFDDAPGRQIYHCPFCNFCRRGRGLGADSFHCMACNACMSVELFDSHRCAAGALAGTCPVCAAALFDSRAPVREPPCGHFMHSACFAAYAAHSYACPVCARSLGDMAVYWKMIDGLLAAEAGALPPELAARRQAVRCNDCGRESEAPFHFMYHKCGPCGSYNTRVL